MAEENFNMSANRFKVDHSFGVVEPFRQVKPMDEAIFGAGIWHSKMRDPCKGKSPAAHDAVGWRSCPTGGDRQASYTLTNFDLRADHVRRTAFEVVRVFAGNSEIHVTGLFGGGNRDEGIDQPGNAPTADGVICRSQSQVFGHRVTAEVAGLFFGFRQHMSPDEVEFLHIARIAVTAVR